MDTHVSLTPISIWAPSRLVDSRCQISLQQCAPRGVVGVSVI